MANRKLLIEIDRSIKKVQEGLQTYDEIWNKAEEATSVSQKEKYEADLKKEIKRLQRQRESIKQWLGNDSIKDKSNLQKYRREIEQRMESFKKCEKAAKTKAYSKEALHRPTAKQDLLSAKQKQCKAWIADVKRKLRSQISEMKENVDDYDRKKAKKKRRADDEEVSAWRTRIEQHNWHIKELTQIWEKIKDGHCPPKVLDVIKDEMEYYITEAWQSPDWPDNEFMYEAFDKEDELGRVIASDDEPPTGVIAVDDMDSFVADPLPDDDDDDDDDNDEMHSAANTSATTTTSIVTPLNTSHSDDRSHRHNSNTSVVLNNNTTSSNKSKKKKNASKQSKKQSKKHKSSNEERDKKHKKSGKPSPSVSSVQSYRSTLSVESNSSTTQSTNSGRPPQHSIPHNTSAPLPTSLQLTTEHDNPASIATKHPQSSTISQQLLQANYNISGNKKSSDDNSHSKSSTTTTQPQSQPPPQHTTNNHNPPLELQQQHRPSVGSSPGVDTSNKDNDSIDSETGGTISDMSKIMEEQERAYKEEMKKQHEEAKRQASIVREENDESLVADEITSSASIDLSASISLPIKTTPQQHSQMPQQLPNIVKPTKPPAPWHQSGDNNHAPPQSTHHPSHIYSQPLTNKVPPPPAPGLTQQGTVTAVNPLPSNNIGSSQPQHRKPPKKLSSGGGGASTGAVPQPNANSLNHDSSNLTPTTNAALNSIVNQQNAKKMKPPPITVPPSYETPYSDTMLPRERQRSDINAQSSAKRSGVASQSQPHQQPSELSAEDFEPPFSASLTEGEKQMLDCINFSYQQLPEIGDAWEPPQFEAFKYTQTPDFFPKEVPILFEKERIFKNFNVDTLFFIFYYQPNTFQQWAAARQLKLRGWAYHTRYQTWFQRHIATVEELREQNENMASGRRRVPLKLDPSASAPASATAALATNNPQDPSKGSVGAADDRGSTMSGKSDDSHFIGGPDDIDPDHVLIPTYNIPTKHLIEEAHESGTYLYFDFDNVWCQRIKTEFHFDYAYLESELDNEDIDWMRPDRYATGLGIIGGERRKRNKLKAKQRQAEIDKRRAQLAEKKARMESTQAEAQALAKQEAEREMQLRQAANTNIGMDGSGAPMMQHCEFEDSDESGMFSPHQQSSSHHMSHGSHHPISTIPPSQSHHSIHTHTHPPPHMAPPHYASSQQSQAQQLIHAQQPPSHAYPPLPTHYTSSQPQQSQPTQVRLVSPRTPTNSAPQRHRTPQKSPLRSTSATNHTPRSLLSPNRQYQPRRPPQQPPHQENSGHPQQIVAAQTTHLRASDPRLARKDAQQRFRPPIHHSQHPMQSQPTQQSQQMRAVNGASPNASPSQSRRSQNVSTVASSAAAASAQVSSTAQQQSAHYTHHQVAPPHVSSNATSQSVYHRRR